MAEIARPILPSARSRSRRSCAMSIRDQADDLIRLQVRLAWRVAGWH